MSARATSGEVSISLHNLSKCYRPLFVVTCSIGYIGGSVAARLIAEGSDVRGLRSGYKYRHRPPSLTAKVVPLACRALRARHPSRETSRASATSSATNRNLSVTTFNASAPAMKRSGGSASPAILTSAWPSLSGSPTWLWLRAAKTAWAFARYDSAGDGRRGDARLRRVNEPAQPRTPRQRRRPPLRVG
jgi:hypothetical protein